MTIRWPATATKLSVQASRVVLKRWLSSRAKGFEVSSSCGAEDITARVEGEDSYKGFATTMMEASTSQFLTSLPKGELDRIHEDYGPVKLRVFGIGLALTFYLYGPTTVSDNSVANDSQLYHLNLGPLESSKPRKWIAPPTVERGEHGNMELVPALVSQKRSRMDAMENPLSW
ncbi:hypothetical protein Patl1_36963 [Pistacia atlantica]|nr:hypothetical protein Patl1_36963 [Pistacia atlantica]